LEERLEMNLSTLLALKNSSWGYFAALGHNRKPPYPRTAVVPRSSEPPEHPGRRHSNPYFLFGGLADKMLVLAIAAIHLTGLLRFKQKLTGNHDFYTQIQWVRPILGFTLACKLFNPNKTRLQPQDGYSLIS
jgi:hypothetical protein